jgi:hypothetical protein
MDGAVLWWCVGVGAHVFARLQVKISQQTRCANADRSPHRRPSGEKGGNDDNRTDQETEADQLLLIHRADRWDAVVVGPRAIMLLNSIYNSPHP